MSAPALAVAPYTFKPVRVYGGGYVDGIVFHPAQANLCYARTDMGGVYRWNNATTSWTPLTDFLNRDQADYMGDLALALDANNVNKVYVMTGKYTQSWAGNGALLTSNDQGASWSIVNLPFKVGGNEDGRGAGERLAVDPNLGSILFAGSNASGLYKSTNSGAAWAAVASFPSTNITFVIFDKSSASTGVATPTIYIGVNATSNNLYRSTDGGSTWALVAGQPSGNIPMRAAWGSSGRLYITYSNALGPNGSTGGAVYRLDGGTAWTNLNAPAGQGGWCGVGVFPGASDQVAIATLDRWFPADVVYHSTNNGVSWTDKLTGATLDETSAPWVSSSTPHWLTTVEVDPFNAAHAFFVTGYGAYMTSNLTAALPTWSYASAGIEQTVPLQLISPPSGAPVLSAMGDVDGFKHDNPDVVPSKRHQPEVGTTLGIAFAEALPAKMVKAYNWGPPNNYGGYSTDGGVNWTLFPSYPAGASGGGTRSIAISPNGTNIVWCPAGAACSYSTNNGSSWTACGGAIPQGLEPVADRVNSSKFYIADWNTGQVWVSTNGGVSFAVGATGLGILPSYQATDYSLKATLGIEGDLWLCTGSNGLWHSTSSGASFTKLGTLSNAYEVSTGKSASAGYPALYCFGTNAGTRGFYRSDDTGATWTRLNDDLHQYGWTHDFSGDPRIYGRLYLCAEGRGALYGDIPVAGSPTFTPTRTSTATPTRSATVTDTRTSSPTATQTPLASTATSTQSPAASTATPTRSSTATATRSSTASPSASPTPSTSPSRTASPSSTPTSSPTAPASSPTSTSTGSSTATRTGSPTVTAPNSSTPTRTITASPSATRTSTPSATASPTPSATMTYTDVPLGSTATDTPSITETRTISPSRTASPSATATGTATSSASPSSSATPSATASSSPSATPTSSVTATPSATSSDTSGPSPSSTETAQDTATLTSTPSSTATAQDTGTPSVTAASTASVTANATATATNSVTPSPTPTSSSTQTMTSAPPASATETAVTTPSPDPSPAEGPLQILAALPLPNPDPSCLALHLSAAADEVVLRVWSPNMRLLAESRALNVPAGWSQVPLPLDFLQSAANGVYFSTVTARSRERKALPTAPGKFLILR